MSCNRGQLACAAGAVASGVSKVASRAAGGLGAGAKQAGRWAAQHPNQTAYLAYVGATVAAYQKKKGTVSQETGQLSGSGLAVSLQRSGNTAPTEKDRALAANIDYGMSQVQRQGVADKLGIRQVTVGDDFAYANKVFELGKHFVNIDLFKRSVTGH